MFVLLAESHALVAVGSAVCATHWIVVFPTGTAGSGILSWLDPSEKMVKKNQNDNSICKILLHFGLEQMYIYSLILKRGKI